jgi:ribosomal protein L37E
MRIGRRPLRRLAVCLVLGVITSWLVAWGFTVHNWTLKWRHRAPVTESYAIVDPYLIKLSQRTGAGIHRQWWYIRRFDYAFENTAINRTRVSVAHEVRGVRFDARKAYEERYGLTVFERLERDFATYEPAYPTPLADRAAAFEDSIVAELVESPEAVRVDVESTGWPSLCLVRAFDLKLNMRPSSKWTYHWSVEIEQNFIAGSTSLPLHLPLRPLWLGLALDTGFYAALWAAPLFGFPMLCRRRRTRKGLCPRCGYELHHAFDSGCPECGWGRSVAASGTTS